MAKFSDILLSLREEKGLGQKDLADLLKLTKGSISNYEKGKFEPDICSIKALADFFDVSTDYLLGVSSDPVSHKHLGEKYTDNTTYGEIYKKLSRIPQKHRAEVLLVVSALSEYLEEYKNLMYSEILKISPNSQYKEDILNDSLVKLIGKIALLRTLERSRLVNYIITTVRNTAIDVFRKNDKYIYSEFDFASESSAEDDVERTVLGKMRIEQFVVLWSTLDAATREILEDKYILELSDHEIANNLGIKPASVRMKLARARASAYKQLEEQMN